MVLDKHTVDSHEPRLGEAQARDVDGRIEGNWKRLGSLAWASIIRATWRERLRRYMTDEGIDEAVINRVLGQHVPKQRVIEKGPHQR